MAVKSWRQIADRLAERLLNHAYCDADGHDNPADHKADCPFCDDIAAYQEYLAKGGTARERPVPGVMVTVASLRDSARG